MADLDTKLQTRGPMGHAIETSVREIVIGASNDGTKALFGDGKFKTPGGLPAGGAVGQVVTNTAPGAGNWQTPGGLLSVTVPLSANDINHAFSTPKTLIAAPGVGKVIVPVQITSLLTVGSVAFGSLNSIVNVYYGNASGATFWELGLSNVESQIFADFAIATLPYADGINKALVLAGTVRDWINAGAIASSILHTGGVGYAPGDTGSIGTSNTQGAIYAVNTVGGGGNVLTYTITNPGQQLMVANDVPTATNTGAGDGNFTIDILSITPGNGSAIINIVHQILPVP